ncbi:MAG: DNRLRE domain-containing protein, partial [Verrucomicrobiota bacterium]|nr:DNRLRE domain-containing protein [Verrucomicrobiota bacterium]
MRNIRSILMLLAGCVLLMGQSLFADQLVLEASDDSWVNGSNPSKTNNYGTATRTVIRYQNATWGFNYALYKFDTSALPANIEVNSVRMRFYTGLSWNNGTPTNFAPVAIFNNTQDWDESTVTFNTAPTYDATATDTREHFGTTENPGNYFTGTNTINTGGWLDYQGAGTVALVQGWADG